MKIHNFLHKKIKGSKWVIAIIIILSLATIFFAIGIDAKLISDPVNTSNRYSIIDLLNIGVQAEHINFFWLISNKSLYTGQGILVSQFNTAIGLTLTGFSLFILGGVIICIYIGTKTNWINEQYHSWRQKHYSGITR